MAIKAGLVGVNPKGVDRNGMPITSGGDGVSEEQLTANGKQFHFAYDETSEKYGYKLDGAGDFIPFNSAGSGIGIMVTDPITTGINLPSGVTLEGGGYQIDQESNTALIGMKLHNTTGAEFELELPFKATSTANKSLVLRTAKSSDYDLPNYTSVYTVSTGYSQVTGNTILFISGTYVYVIGYIRLD